MAQNYVTDSKWRIKGNKSGAKHVGKTLNSVALSLVYGAPFSKEFLGSRPPSLLHVSSSSCLYLFHSVCSSPWQMPHTLDVSNLLGTCAIFVCNILRNILIDS